MDKKKILEIIDIISNRMDENDIYLIQGLKSLIFDEEPPQYISMIDQVFVDLKYEEEFSLYLREERQIKEISVDKYFDSLSKVKEILEYTYNITIPFNLYTVADYEWFINMINDFESNQKNINLNLKWHHILSAAYNNYKNFLRVRSNTFKKVMLNSKTIFYCDVTNKKICRKPSNSNLKQVGSDNSLYFGIKDESIMYDLLKNILSVDDNNFNQKFKMKAYNQYIDVETNLNKQNQVQVKIIGDGKMANIFDMYQIKQMSPINPENIYFCIDFKHNEITILNESEINA